MHRSTVSLFDHLVRDGEERRRHFEMRLERFEREFVSLFVLAKQQVRAVKKELDAAGIKPALNPEKIGATFYRQRDVAPAFSKAPTSLPKLSSVLSHVQNAAVRSANQ